MQPNIYKYILLNDKIFIFLCMENQSYSNDENLIKRGRMTKSPLEMKPDELKIWEQTEQAFVRDHLFSIGQPLVYKKNGVMVVEFANGRTEKL